MDIKRVTTYFPEKIATAIKQIADKNRRSFNSEVMIALEKHIKEEERKRKVQ